MGFASGKGASVCGNLILVYTLPENIMALKCFAMLNWMLLCNLKCIKIMSRRCVFVCLKYFDTKVLFVSDLLMLL